jgi:hypothetical protein
MKYSLICLAALGALACGSSESVSIPQGSGLLRVQLTDAPFPFDSVQSVDIHVVLVDARLAEPDSAEAARGASDDSVSVGGWTTIARPDKAFDLVKLRGGTVADLGSSTIPEGDYNGFRLVIDPLRSGVTLKGGMTLTGASNPSVSFPSAARTGIKVNLDRAIEIDDQETSTMVIDFDLEKSFVMRGNSIGKNGLLFKPVLQATLRAAP